jgi:4-hydroxythreonine-4-phosphate dehydrogenase
MARPKIALTMGDPAGVGPELVLRAVADEGVLAAADPVVYGAREALEMVARRLGLDMPEKGRLREVTAMDTAGLTPGLPDPEAGRAMIECIEGAVLDALAERVDAVVTAPINKETARLAGFGFPGHTEFIAHL